MRKRTLVVGPALVAAIATVLAMAAPAGAAGDFKLDGVGKIKISGCATGYNVCIDTGVETGSPDAVWFGLRVFTIAPGTMTGHSELTTSSTDGRFKFGPAVGSSYPCISDFGGTGASRGSGVPVGALDPGIAMVGGFVGPDTGCISNTGTTGQSKFINFSFPTTGGNPTFAFYGAFYGTEAASWRDDVGNSPVGHAQWWNLWGNFTSLAYSTSQ